MKYSKYVVTFSCVLSLTVLAASVHAENFAITGNGVGSNNNLNFTNNNSSTVVQQNNSAQVTNDVNANADTGHNSIDNGSITTGNATVNVNITNNLNSNNATVTCCSTSPTPKPTISLMPTIAATPTPGNSNNGGDGGENNGGTSGSSSGSSGSGGSGGEVLGLSGTASTDINGMFYIDPQLFNRPSLVNTGVLPENITINSININLSVVEAPIVDGYWQLSDSTASHGEGSANPGQIGNDVIFAHDRWGLFWPLQFIKVGDTITLNNKFNYQVTEIKNVNPDDTSVVAPTPFEQLTLFTCTGVGDTQRLVVKAKPLLQQGF